MTHTWRLSWSHRLILATKVHKGARRKEYIKKNLIKSFWKSRNLFSKRFLVAEGMAFPSLAKLLRERFQMDVISRNVSTHKNGDTMEVDVLAYSNSRVNEIYVGEIKSRFRQEDFKQMKDILNRFFEFFPSHKGKRRESCVLQTLNRHPSASERRAKCRDIHAVSEAALFFSKYKKFCPRLHRLTHIRTFP